MLSVRLFWRMVCAGLLAGAPGLTAARRTATASAPDRIDVIAHIPLSGGPVTQLTAGAHWQKNYLYVDHGSNSPVAVLDVTNPAAPATAGELEVPKQEAGGTLSAVVGTAALMTSAAPAPMQQTAAETVSILSFAEPQHPTVARRFPGVTAMLKDSARDLIYLADSNSLWVLRVEPATDPQLDEEYAQYVLYDH